MRSGIVLGVQSPANARGQQDSARKIILPGPFSLGQTKRHAQLTQSLAVFKGGEPSEPAEKGKGRGKGQFDEHRSAWHVPNERGGKPFKYV